MKKLICICIVFVLFLSGCSFATELLNKATSDVVETMPPMPTVLAPQTTPEPLGGMGEGWYFTHMEFFEGLTEMPGKLSAGGSYVDKFTTKFIESGNTIHLSYYRYIEKTPPFGSSQEIRWSNPPSSFIAADKPFTIEFSNTITSDNNQFASWVCSRFSMCDSKEIPTEDGLFNPSNKESTQYVDAGAAQSLIYTVPKSSYDGERGVFDISFPNKSMVRYYYIWSASTPAMAPTPESTPEPTPELTPEPASKPTPANPKDGLTDLTGYKVSGQKATADSIHSEFIKSGKYLREDGRAVIYTYFDSSKERFEFESYVMPGTYKEFLHKSTAEFYLDDKKLAFDFCFWPIEAVYGFEYVADDVLEIRTDELFRELFFDDNAKGQTEFPDGTYYYMGITSDTTQAPANPPTPKPASAAKPPATAPSTEKELFYNGNISAVKSGPTKATTFKLTASTDITTITTYHYFNNGTRPGWIALLDKNGKSYGSWQAVGREGSGVKNAYWDVFPNITLPAGTYTIKVSDTKTWSHNNASNNAGFAWVYGFSSAAAKPPTEKPPVNNGNASEFYGNFAREYGEAEYFISLLNVPGGVYVSLTHVQYQDNTETLIIDSVKCNQTDGKLFFDFVDVWAKKGKGTGVIEQVTSNKIKLTISAVSSGLGEITRDAGGQYKRVDEDF